MLRANIFWQLIRYLALYSVNYRVPFVFTCVQLYSSSLLVFHSCSLVFTRVLSCSIRVHSCSIRVHLCSLVFTRVHRCSLVFRLVWSFRSDPSILLEVRDVRASSPLSDNQLFLKCLIKVFSHVYRKSVHLKNWPLNSMLVSHYKCPLNTIKQYVCC